MAALASAVAALSGNPSCAPKPPLGFYPPTLIPSNWYLANMPRSIQSERMEIEKPGEQPLDLSSKGTTCSNSPVEHKVAPPVNTRIPSLETKQIFK